MQMCSLNTGSVNSFTGSGLIITVLVNAMSSSFTAMINSISAQ